MARRLYRSSQDRQLGGVCGGIAEYLDLDPSLVRIGALLLLIVGGTGFLAYLVAWLIIPSEKKSDF
ncbi:putative stress-responsive transcriptional regulator [Desulfosporosinus acidiphilus SJ4]|uniref:Putative stress-responsive transcriptional regulator n=1 Tax=Desulfosporosinus acidiphilus (strain DSM 22704 / JCM 16185 / SJ4) TaxID=646529 RepID=I4D6C9_DESAJ|nr:PspC domain-containing protein [Desulfosporosinus acidiphilus]AFM41353.1 putative stress-responsive transcriptional regulator [Desulfosporosinus acidiphilus SJ4]